MKKLKNSIVFGVFVLFVSIGFAQNETDCALIQCDCDNIPNADIEQIELCKYYQSMMISKCNKGVKSQKCRPEASGPNMWVPSKKVDVIPIVKDPVETFEDDTLDNLLQEIRNAEYSFDKYEALHDRIAAFQNRKTGLSLSMELSDLTSTVQTSSSSISTAFRFASYNSTYSEAALELFLPRLVRGLGHIGELQVDQIDMKYELALIFQNMKDNGIDVQAMFEEGAHYHDAKILDFIKECYSNASTHYSAKQMRDLRKISNRIYLQNLNRMIPSAYKKDLSKPVRLVAQDVLDWNEQLIKEALTGLKVVADYIATKSWDQDKMKQVSENYDKVFNDEIWNKKRYSDSLVYIAKELPIVWELMKAIFLKR